MTKYNKKGFSSALLFAFLIIIALSFSSCQKKEEPKCSDIVEQMTSACESPPFGILYSTKSSKGSPDYLSDSLAATLLGNGSLPAAITRASDFSIRVSSSVIGFEMAAVKCQRQKDAEEVAELFQKRIDVIRGLWNSGFSISPQTNESGEFPPSKILIYRNYVIMALSDKCDEAVKIAKSLIG